MILEIALWLLVVELLNIVSLPLVLRIFGNLRDRGLCVSKIFALLVASYLVWIFSYVIGYNAVSISIAILVLCAISAFLLIKSNVAKNFDIKSFARNEVIFIAAFLFFTFIKFYTSAIYDGEKFQDIAFLNALVRTDGFPPYDPWMSGHALNYYYFGYFIVSILVKVSSIPTAVAFNLAIALFFALAVNAAYGFGYNLTKKAKYGAIAVLFTVLLGTSVGFVWLFCSPNPLNPAWHVFNPESFAPFCQIFTQGGGYIDFNSDYVWASTRVINGTINEFPYFSFIFGDLHAHMVSISFQLMALLLFFNFFGRKLKIADVAIIALVIGFFFPLNSWEYPTYLILFMLLIFVKDYETGLISAVKKTAKISLPVIALSILFYLPYHLTASPSILGIGLVSERTQIQFYLVHLLIFLFFICLFIYASVEWSKNLRGGALVLALASILIAFIVNFQLLAIVIPLLFLSLHSLKRKEDEVKFIAALIITGLLLTTFCELVFFKDGFQQPFERMNTVFKLYMQLWLFFSLSAAFAVYYARERLCSSKVLAAFAILLVVIGIFYPVSATFVRANGFSLGSTPTTLDGMLFLKKMTGGAEEYEALSWINGNITGHPVILERSGVDYTYASARYVSRVSAFTGLPTILGWPGHEIQWRLTQKNISNETGARSKDISEIYTSSDMNETASLIKKYGISYIYVGREEKDVYTIGDKFETHPDVFELAFNSSWGGVKVYRVVV
jgi:YYY domain-containing protein